MPLRLVGFYNDSSSPKRVHSNGDMRMKWFGIGGKAIAQSIGSTRGEHGELENLGNVFPDRLTPPVFKSIVFLLVVFVLCWS